DTRRVGHHTPFSHRTLNRIRTQCPAVVAHLVHLSIERRLAAQGPDLQRRSVIDVGGLRRRAGDVKHSIDVNLDRGAITYQGEVMPESIVDDARAYDPDVVTC